MRAGKDLTPTSWPNGAKVAVLLSFDVDNETVAWWEGEPTISELSRGEYGSRVALRRIIDLLKKEDVPASFFIPALSLHLAPKMADEIKRLPRHEFAVHGWIHERNTQVPADKEREMVINSIKMLTDLTGEKPVGYRAPSWDFSAATRTRLTVGETGGSYGIWTTDGTRIAYGTNGAVSIEWKAANNTGQIASVSDYTFTGNHNVSRTFDSVCKRFAAAVKIVEF